MRSADIPQNALFSYQTLGEFVPPKHPLRAMRDIVNRALRELVTTFNAMCAPVGRDSIPPEQLRRGLILQSLYAIPSERLPGGQLGYNMLY